MVYAGATTSLFWVLVEGERLLLFGAETTSFSVAAAGLAEVVVVKTGEPVEYCVGTVTTAGHCGQLQLHVGGDEVE